MINKEIEDITFADLLGMQKQLDGAVAKPRKNGFVPRLRNRKDILLSIDDEFQEWARELPDEYNFKTWKQKEYSRERELEELTDILFFFLQYCHYAEEFAKKVCGKIEIEVTDKQIKELEKIFLNTEVIDCNLGTKIYMFKHELWSKEVMDVKAFNKYIDIVNCRGFSKEELINCYCKKWNKNMERINGDWSL